ncbi:MAG TPA: hypothetical protein VJ826_11845 [Candidatus Polarisedimenticolaceae bacterium]|nr:hypothetical protein [Candidatus Polarisedimenticolaceae bacterium]
MKNLRFFLATSITIFCASSQAGALSIEERISGQTAVERVQWTHRTGEKPSFEDVIRSGAIEEKVRRSLAQSVALEEVWGDKLSAYRLRREVDRMTRGSRDRTRLAELFAALHDDPVLIQEVIARPALVDRLIRSRFDNDADLQAAPRRRAEGIAGSHPGARVEEEEAAFVVVSEADGSARRIERIDKESFDAWWAANAPRFDPSSAKTVGDAAASLTCAPDDTWDGGLTVDPPTRRIGHAAVWTGSELIIWGGMFEQLPTRSYFSDGKRYDPATDTWTPLPASPLQARVYPSAAWTGDAVLIWGGGMYPVTTTYTIYSNGALYDPILNTWTSTPTGAPAARWKAAAVKIGNYVVVYGGQLLSSNQVTVFPTNTGARFNVTTRTWASMSASPLPSNVLTTTAGSLGNRAWFWTGSQGAGYIPSIDGWSLMLGTGPMPGNLAGPVVLGTDREVIVWGGGDTNAGAAFNPVTLNWRAMATPPGAPGGGLDRRAVWTGKTMLVWGGNGSWDGGDYDPVADTWTAIEMKDVPEVRTDNSLTWTGTEAILFGGTGIQPFSNDAPGYDPVARRWTRAGTTDPMVSSAKGQAWTGTEWLQVGTYLGARYDPRVDLWFETPGHPAPNAGRAVTVGNVVVAFGTEPFASSCCDFVGGRYHIASNSWDLVTQLDAPDPRARHTMVSTGSRALVWGGKVAGGAATSTGGSYDPLADAWTLISTVNAPSARMDHTAVWTGSKMLVWGGSASNDGGAYDPSTDTWAPLPASPLSGRSFHSAVWTGSKMIVWGGATASFVTLGDGAMYDPSTGVWTPISNVGAPSARYHHTAVWTGRVMLVWGGSPQPGWLNTGAKYDPATDTWSPMSMSGVPAARAGHTMAWTGSFGLVWGGGVTGGGRYALGHAVDDDGDGLSECSGDCNDGDASIWSPPTEITGLSIQPDKATISWNATSGGSTGPTTYTLYRSTRADLFVASTCPVMTPSATAATDAEIPTAGTGFYYVVGGGNGCTPTAPAGAWTNGTDRGATCAP